DALQSRDGAKAEARAALKPGESPQKAGPPLTGTISGYWGFDHFTGPTLLVQDFDGTDWKIAPDSKQIIAGQENHMLLTSTGTACVKAITVEQSGEKISAEFKPTDQPNTLDVSV